MIKSRFRNNISTMKKNYLFLFLFAVAVQWGWGQVNEWTWMNGDSVRNSCGHYGTQGVPAPQNTPASFYVACEWKDNQGFFWLYGGVDSCLGNASDLWKFDPSTNDWTWIKGNHSVNFAGNYGIQGVPSPTNNPSCKGWGTPTWVDNNNNLWLYSGPNGSDDLWKYDIATNEWTWMR